MPFAPSIPHEVQDSCLKNVKQKDLRAVACAAHDWKEAVERERERRKALMFKGAPVFALVGGACEFGGAAPPAAEPFYFDEYASELPPPPLALDETSVAVLSDGRIALYGRVMRNTEPLGNDPGGCFKVYIFSPTRWRWEETRGLRPRRFVTLVALKTLNGPELRAFGGYRVASDVGAYADPDHWGEGADFQGAGGRKTDWTDVLPAGSLEWHKGAPLEMPMQRAVVIAPHGKASTPMLWRRGNADSRGCVSENPRVYSFEPCNPINRPRFYDTPPAGPTSFGGAFGGALGGAFDRIMSSLSGWSESHELRQLMNKTIKSNIYAACGAGSCQWVPALRAEPWETVAVMRPFKYIALAVILRTFSYSRQVQSEHASQTATVHCCNVKMLWCFNNASFKKRKWSFALNIGKMEQSTPFSELTPVLAMRPDPDDPGKRQVLIGAVHSCGHELRKMDTDVLYEESVMLTRIPAELRTVYNIAGINRAGASVVQLPRYD